MSRRVLLVGPVGHGGEGVYVNALEEHPPDGVIYSRAGGFHEGAPGARCSAFEERLLNRVLRRVAIPDMGFRSLRVRDRFDLIHVHAHPARLSGARGTPLVMSENSSAAVYLRDYLGWDEGRLTSGLRRARRLYRLFGIADRLLTLERASRAYVFSEWARGINVRWGADPAKLEVIPPGFPPRAHIDRSDRDGFTLLFIGRDFERKGGFELIEAFAQAIKEIPGLRLVMESSDPADRNPDRLIHEWVGEARRRHGLELIARLERDGHVRKTAATRAELMGSIYPCADAFVMPTHAEGFGFTNIEAMSFGLPVITTTAGPSQEIVEDGVTGLLVTPGDVGALRDAILRLAGEPEAARRMGDEGRARFLDRFTLERFRARLGKFYDDAMESN